VQTIFKATLYLIEFSRKLIDEEGTTLAKYRSCFPAGIDKTGVAACDKYAHTADV